MANRRTAHPMEARTPRPMPDDVNFRFTFTEQYYQLQERGFLPEMEEEIDLKVYHVEGDGTPDNPGFFVVSSDGHHFVRLYPGTREFQDQSHIAPMAEEFMGGDESLTFLGIVKTTVRLLMRFVVGILDILGPLYPWLVVLRYFIVALQVLFELITNDNLPEEIRGPICALKEDVKNYYKNCY